MPHLKLIADLPGHSEPAWSVIFNPTKPIIASSSTDKTVRIYSYSFPNDNEEEGGVEDGGDGHGETKAKSEQKLLPIIHYHSTLPTSSHKRTIRSLAFSPSGSTLATGSFDSSIGIWEERIPEEEEGDGEGDDETSGVEPINTQRGEGEEKQWENVTTLDGHESEVKSVGFSSDGGLLASCSRDKSVWIWEVQPDSDFECIAVMLEHTQDVKCLAWHPSEEILATGSYDASILLFADDPDGDWSPFQKIQPKLEPTKPTISSAVAATATTTSSITTIPIPPLKEPETIWSLSFSPCGRFLLSGGDSGTLRIFQRSGKTMESPWIEMGCWDGHGGRATFGVSWQAVGGEGRDEEKDGEGQERVGRVVSGGGDGRIVLWDVSKSEDGNIHLTLLDSISSAHNLSDVNSVTFCHRTAPPDVPLTKSMKVVLEQTRGMMASCGDDGSVKIWMVVD